MYGGEATGAGGHALRFLPDPEIRRSTLSGAGAACLVPLPQSDFATIDQT